MAIGFKRLLETPIDGASLAVFRICFGLVLAWEAYRYLLPKSGGSRIQNLFVEPVWTFPYHGFEWVRPLPDPWMSIVGVLWGVAGLAVALGLAYRFSAICACVLTTYVFLLDAALYLNHFYLMCLISFLLIWLPVDRCWSVDAWRRKTGEFGRAIVPYWPLLILRAQMFFVYFYGGIAKFDGDWLTGSAMYGPARKALGWLDLWLYPAHAAWIKTLISHQSLAVFLSLGGLAFDLSICFLLFWRRTRWMGLAMAAFFHTFNNFTFSIGVFPVLAFASTLLFCEPDWPRRVFRWLRRPVLWRPSFRWMIAGSLLVPVFGWLAGWRAAKAAPIDSQQRKPIGRWAVAFVCGWLLIQTCLPLRHYLIEGDANWTEEGHRFSWRMMLRSKAGILRLAVHDPAMFVAGADGQIDINWDEWCKHYEKVSYLDVDAQHVEWRQLPPIVVLFEPLVGERIVLNHLSRQRAIGSDLEAEVRKNWLRTYGREPEILDTRELKDGIHTLCQRLRFELKTGDRNTQERREWLIGELDLAGQTPVISTVDIEKRSAQIDAIVSRLLQDSEAALIVRQELSTIKPFALQGNWGPMNPVKVIRDSQLEVVDCRERVQLDRKVWKHTHQVLVDTCRLTHYGWQGLDSALVIVRDGQPILEWNQHCDLHSRQQEMLAQLPFMAHQYSRRIARNWQSVWDRYPQVFAAYNSVQFNTRIPQAIVDPAADLASVPIKLFGHNDWILHLKRPKPNQATAPRPIDIDSEGLATLRYANGIKHSENWTEIRDGHEYSVTQVWDEDGRLIARAEYRDGQMHGTAQQWHFNGQLAMQVNYRDGVRHGPAEMWYLDGQKSWEAEFVNGQRQGIATGWYGDGRIAEQAEFSAGTLVRMIDDRRVDQNVRQASGNTAEHPAFAR